MMRGLSHLAALLATCALLPGCAVNPATGGADVVLMSEYSEIKKGREMHEELMADGTAAYPDEAVQDYVDRVGQQLARASDRPDIEYTFTVLDNQNINAFAFPGGFIYINRGLMTYLDSEAELAAVLAHEIGHVTARHAVRQQSAQVANQTMAQLTYILTGSGDLASASNQYGTQLVRGYGREHELEADSEGAEYLHNAGYDPNALLEVISVLKDQETYDRVQAREAGRRPKTYHGVFATHPRNDQRLQEVIRTAGTLESVVPRELDHQSFREMMQGLTYGEGGAAPQREDNRFYHNKLGFTFAHPENWTVNRSAQAIVTAPGDGAAKMTLTIARRDADQPDREFLTSQLKAPGLLKLTELKQAGLTGHTGISPATDAGSRRRVAVIHRGGISYLFEGTVAADKGFKAQDPHFLSVIESFRPMLKNERDSGNKMHIEWIMAEPGMTYASLSRGLRIPDAENQLRLINGQYPRGEPRAGDWIKVIRE